MLSSYRNEKTWPEIFLRVYIEDAVAERTWVDLPGMTVVRFLIKNIY